MSRVLNVVTDSELQSAIDSNDTVVVVFSAKDWCVPCRRLEPHINVASEKMPQVVFVEVDIDKSESIRKAYDVMSVPTVVGFKYGQRAADIKGRTAIPLVNEISNM